MAPGGCGEGVSLSCWEHTRWPSSSSSTSCCVCVWWGYVCWLRVELLVEVPRLTCGMVSAERAWMTSCGRIPSLAHSPIPPAPPPGPTPSLGVHAGTEWPPDPRDPGVGFPDTLRVESAVISSPADIPLRWTPRLFSDTTSLPGVWLGVEGGGVKRGVSLWEGPPEMFRLCELIHFVSASATAPGKTPPSTEC